MIEYVSTMKDKDKDNIYRFMTDEEQHKFKNYMVPVCIINGNLTFEEQDYIQEQINCGVNIMKFSLKWSNNDDEEDFDKFSRGLRFYGAFSKNDKPVRLGKTDFALRSIMDIMDAKRNK